MQGMHIFRRDRTMQLIKCTPWSRRLHPHPTIIKKMKTFLEVERKMGPIPQPTSSQYRPPQLARPSTASKPGKTAVQPPVTVSKVLEAPENRLPPLEKAQVCKSTPWPGAGRMSGNLFENRNWLLPPNYLNNNCKNVTSPKSPI